MKLFITVIFIILLFGCASYNKAMKNEPKKITYHDVGLQIVYTYYHIEDWAYTNKGSRHLDDFAEKNPILGTNPSEGRVNSYFAITLVGHTYISYKLPKPYRTIWQIVWIAIQYDVVKGNTRDIGGNTPNIRVNFPF